MPPLVGPGTSTRSWAANSRVHERRRCLQPGDGVSEVARSKRFLNTHRIAVVDIAERVVAGGEQEWDATLLEHVGDRIARLAIEVQVENGEIELTVASGRKTAFEAVHHGHDLVAELDEKILDIERDEDLILDDKRGP